MALFRVQDTTVQRVVIGLAGVALFGAACSDKPSDSTSAGVADGTTSGAPAALGAPVTATLAPAVVPASAELDPGLSNAGRSATYLMPPGVSESDVIAWYRTHMPSGSDFHDLTWLEELPADPPHGADWYWCSGPSESLDVSFGQNDPDDGGAAFVAIAIQHVSDGACD